MNSKSTDFDTTVSIASFHTHHAVQLEPQAAGGAIRLRRKADSLDGVGWATRNDAVNIPPRSS
jgi:hypothetical protein